MNDFRGWEFKVITGTDQEIQKWLNQWTHEFKMDIISMVRENQLTVLLSRKKML